MSQHRSTQRRLPVGRTDEDRLVADMIELTRQYGRYGYRRIAALLRDAGWQLNDKRVERLWRREGLKVPMKQPMKGRLWMNPSRDIAAQYSAGQRMDHVSGCVRRTATMSVRMTLAIVTRTNGVLNGSMHHRTDDGKAFGTLNILDEHSRECPLSAASFGCACRATGDPSEAEAELG